MTSDSAPNAASGIPEEAVAAQPERKRKSERRRRCVMVSVRFAPDELAAVQEDAGGQPVSGWLRDLALPGGKRPVTDIVSPARTLAADLPLTGCPVRCDPECDASCHEAHVPDLNRAHDPGFQCGEAQILAAAARLQERARIIGLASQLRASFPADHPKGAQASFADYLRLTSADRLEATDG